jgi:starch phosphorylase
VDPPLARPRQRFEAVAKLIRDLLAHRWVKTRQTRERANPKRVYYLSMEFLIGRTLTNNSWGCTCTTGWKRTSCAARPKR